MIISCFFEILSLATQTTLFSIQLCLGKKEVIHFCLEKPVCDHHSIILFPDKTKH